MPDSGLYDVIVVGGGPRAPRLPGRWPGVACAWPSSSAPSFRAKKSAAISSSPPACEFSRPWASGSPGSVIAFADNVDRIYFGPRLGYRGAIPYYPAEQGLPAHGFIVPRHISTHHLLERARAVCARVYEGCAARRIRREDRCIHVDVREWWHRLLAQIPADRGCGWRQVPGCQDLKLASDDHAHISVAQRAYVEGVSLEGGEATVWFDEDIVPGYGWMFPMSGGRANVGVGILSETCRRHGHSVPKAFAPRRSSGSRSGIPAARKSR